MNYLYTSSILTKAVFTVNYPTEKSNVSKDGSEIVIHEIINSGVFHILRMTFSQPHMGMNVLPFRTVDLFRDETSFLFYNLYIYKLLLKCYF